MGLVAPQPGTGIDRRTGRILSGWDHVLQSLEVIFSTRFGSRVLRRWFGSDIPKLLGEKLVPSTVLRFWTAVAIAIDTWEPRYRITRIGIAASAEQARLGGLGFTIYGAYMPRGHLGDPTPEGERTVAMTVNDRAIRFG
ncbi:GPW/gp25 family protein [Rhodoplanes sp. SY1]|uniref:GPW/gp25 family protein n=1 Tax=Rhodoplanes sp. SY1 TaxID=3166646 RepID=UPI0038B4E049